MSCLKDVVVCKFTDCNQVYNDPRFLPCGHRTCAAHIEEMMVNSDDERRMIKCHFCQKIHVFPDDGGEFPVDRNIPLLLSITYSKEHSAAKKHFSERTWTSSSRHSTATRTSGKQFNPSAPPCSKR